MVLERTDRSSSIFTSTVKRQRMHQDDIALFACHFMKGLVTCLLGRLNEDRMIVLMFKLLCPRRQHRT